MKRVKRICKFCGEPFDCLNRNCYLKGECQVANNFTYQNCSCRDCYLVRILRSKHDVMGWQAIDEVFLRCWDLKGKELEELKRIARMIA